MPDLRYPIGLFVHDGPVTDADLDRWIGQIEALPAQLREAVRDFDDLLLDTPYRPGGWTLRQVVHHVPDSHLNCYVRFKWALTEDTPTIKPYDEVGWAGLPDVRSVPVGVSLDLLAALHARWTGLLRGLPREAFDRTFVHPVSGPTTLALATGSYAWHGRHHLAHITRTVERKGWR